MWSIVSVLVIFVGVCFGAPNQDPTRIVGGKPATILEYPSIVQLSTYYAPLNIWLMNGCGGTILSTNIVVSAAHCVDLTDHDVNYYSVRAAASIVNRFGVIAYVTEIIVHPAYQHETLEADICVIRLRDHLTFGDAILSVPILPQGFVIPGNSPGIYAGWGFNYEHEDVLRHVDVNILSHDECERRYGDPLHEDVICAGYGGKDACLGDSGGPLYYGGVLAGIISDGPFPCGHQYLPGIAIRTAYYSDWIISIANSWRS